MKPSLEYKDAIRGAMHEVLSAISALCMPPDPIKDAPESAVYLCDLDATAQHAREHLHAVFDLLNRADRERSQDRERLTGRGVKP